MMDLSYILNELGEEHFQLKGAIVPPIFQNSNFAFQTLSDMREGVQQEQVIPFYTRGNNPTVEVLRKKIAALEGTEDALMFASGSTAIAAAVMANVQTGDHVVCVQNPYSWTFKLLQNYLPRFGVTATFIDGSDVKNYENAIQKNTKILFLESPNSFTFELQDIEAVVQLAKKYNLLTIMDNSYATPYNQKPAESGVDIICHSATKYLNGHSDVVAGALCGSKEQISHIFKTEFMNIGGILGPMEAWLLIRGLRTFALRMDRVAQTTPKIVDFLYNHPKVSRVLYPFHPSHPQFELAKKQMKNPAGQFTLELNVESKSEVELFCNSLKRFLMACSWGSYESLIFPSLAVDENIPTWKMIRFYIGLEEPEVLLQDLSQALQKIS